MVTGSARDVRYNGGMEIAPLTDAHLDAALDLWRRTEHLAPAPREEVEGLRAHDAGLVLAAVDEGRLLGVVLGSWDGRRGAISRLAVDTTTRRRGVAQALVKELEDRLRERGCTRVSLFVYGGNDAGRAFWSAAGYREAPDVVMFSRSLVTACDGGAVDDDAHPGC
ncbi:GNAT family N-acetyltransferase [Egicoccus sp. AB-alg2]|uniref:GNAT family N-acetyltransferase n=1 Tax=Egicoccus sp. AB-alg2 TaxID=3242693 RepID=UPI00359E9E6F